MFTDWYDSEVIVHTSPGVDDFGATIPGASVTVPCAIAETVRLVRNPQGEQVASSTTLHAALSYSGVFAPDLQVEFDSPSGHHNSQILSISVRTGDPDLEGVSVSLE